MFDKQYELIIGRAGTGKTYAAQKYAEDNPDTVLAATTGIAATNLGAGTTINSLLWYSDTESLETRYMEGLLHERINDLIIGGVRRIILDESSMLSAEQLDLIVKGIDEANSTHQHDGCQLSLTLCGDHCQLPPVKGKFAFEADCWDRFASNKTELTKIYRQEDADFIEALGLIRQGKGKSAAPFFESFIHKKLDHEFRGTTAVPHNSDVRKMNQAYLDKIHKPYMRFRSYRTGIFLKEWDNIPHELLLKEGCLVMILANKRVEGETVEGSLAAGHTIFEYVNGDLGILVGGDPDLNKAEVKLFRTGETVTVHMHRMKNEDFRRSRGGKIKRREIGSVSYVPIRAAHASTIHKTQSCSLDSIQIDFRKAFCGYPGMMYVALSRARTAKGLRLVGSNTLFMRRCNIDRRVIPWL